MPENKTKKVKKYRVRRFVKEMKRIRWPSQKTNWTSFLKVVIFTLLFTAVVVLFATLITLIWTKLGLN
ncbi:preprotein translocase subunit SecE [Mycoplasma sp. ES3157-GEN-MYC]|uniref:Preprotein translocase subunit SecE n=1 Tax=Mycoplasma miroungigenitalium TaxID=754515 RepID=A0A6M4JBA0_9MOLU|nr:preprotein translocase subunit SecE [Mycoplasma miroungigenitalium]MBU4690433.1 preprotein translocase subunit SecE [Mycoplasma miroungigenitalium]MBU4691700.1 preprotein translocase subunit SecE [Mycoplasma miroungigenitalium]QJR43528.1 preprotein translocase subunit SecE [Mycoplasma miroungigenitalium]